MSIKRIKDFQDGNTSLTEDDIFLFMDNPSGDGITKKVSLSAILLLPVLWQILMETVR